MTSKKSTSAKKEKLFHPSSRKAGQLARKAIRQTKLSSILHDRHKKHNTSGTSQIRLVFSTVVHALLLVDLYGFFFNAIPDEGVLTLGELRQLVQDRLVNTLQRGTRRSSNQPEDRVGQRAQEK
jgi:translation machinery-associated protein 16